MDHTSFDRVTRAFADSGTRRAVMMALLGVALLPAVQPASATRKQHRRGKKRVAAQAQPGLRDCPNPGPGKNLSNCDFTGADLSRVNLQGTNLSGASFERAILRGGNLRGANLTGAHLERADLCAALLNGANLSKSDLALAFLQRADLRGTKPVIPSEDPPRFCQTIMPNGSVNNTNCPPNPNVICCFNEDCVPFAGIPRICDEIGQCCVASGINIGTLPRFLCCSREKEPDGKCI